MRSKKRMLVAVGVGALASYYLDPDRGHARRVRDADRTRAALRGYRRRSASRARYEAGREKGREAMLHGAGHFHPVDDHSVAEHLRAVLAKLDVDTHDVNIEVVDGVVRLRGQVIDHGAEAEIVRAVDGEPGVLQIESLLHLPGHPAPNKDAALRATAESR